MPLFRAVIFTVHDMRFSARCALEASNAAKVRIDKIQEIIAESKYSIHDLSRTQLDRIHKLPRFNMPFELGLDLGCKRFGKRHQREKVILILDVERFRYQKFISDISGQDIYAHNGSQRQVIYQIRDWLRPQLDPEKVIIPSGAEILARFRTFKLELPTLSRRLRWDPRHLNFADYVYAAASWISENPL